MPAYVQTQWWLSQTCFSKAPHLIAIKFLDIHSVISPLLFLVEFHLWFRIHPPWSKDIIQNGWRNFANCTLRNYGTSPFSSEPSSIGIKVDCLTVPVLHDDVIKWKHIPRYWHFMWGIHRSPVNSPHIGQLHGAILFSVAVLLLLLIWAWINGWVNNRETLVIWDAIALTVTSL